MTGGKQVGPLERLRHGELIATFFHHVMDQIEQRPSSGVNKPLQAIVLTPDKPRGKSARSLVEAFHNPDTSDSEIWEELQYISNKYLCFEIKLGKKRSIVEPEWAHAKLYFQTSAEELVRSWIGRPTKNRIDVHWRDLLESSASEFEAPEGIRAFRQSAPVLPAGCSSYEAFLTHWLSVGDVLKSSASISWRQLSAMCFWADSKYLDSMSQQACVRSLYPGLSERIVERPILLHVYLPREICAVLIIENQDSFTEMVGLQPKNTALVYGMGYRASAKRVRARGVPNFSLYGCNGEAGNQSWFERWWVQEETQSWPVFFWGDLDYAGFDIAASLKQSFAELKCWKPGYLPMLELLKSGGGHVPEQANKSRQRACSRIGCAYADETLLPEMEVKGRFVDQEAVDISSVARLHQL